MRWLIAGLALVGLGTVVYAQTTFLGNCGSNITGIQLSTGNIYCVVPPSSCSPGRLDYALTCNTVFQMGTLQ